jgi:hypothetical protein
VVYCLVANRGALSTIICNQLQSSATSHQAIAFDPDTISLLSGALDDAGMGVRDD